MFVFIFSCADFRSDEVSPGPFIFQYRKTCIVITVLIFSVYETGVLERAQCGMKLGWGEGYEQFNGCIDDVRTKSSYSL